ncbi:hypothetical protein B0A52_06927 [Exophiala mesophila]|uniref:Uncharacterized protein n=1 Tax=Exophiala mesophila TaxID=212818 RepID=A0A438N0X5_EXOME|nr:hypothetical protein B0A52_06927 [Exophiala mesophila]
MRAIVGNGSIKPLKAVYFAWIPVVPIGTRQLALQAPSSNNAILNPFIFFIYPDVLLTLLYTGVVYAVNYTITATISSAYAELYPFLSDTTLGLCYLSTGGGMMLGSTVTGKMLDWEFKRMKKRCVTPERNSDRSGEVSDEGSFSIERARLRTMPGFILVFLGCTMAWGWCLESKASVAVPLALQFIRGCYLLSKIEEFRLQICRQ